MKLNRNIVTVRKEINTLESWQVLASPMGGDLQWKDGRSAKELARYITNSLPQMPTEIEAVLKQFAPADAAFDWKAEYVTSFSAAGYGRGMGRNHDMVIYNEDLFVGVEAKADEPFGDKTVKDELSKASENKKNRICKLTELVFGDGPQNHLDLRYQLLTACGGVMLEAQKRHSKNAMLLVLVFLKDDCYTQENVQQNNRDWSDFLRQLKAVRTPDGYYKVPQNQVIPNTNLYIHKIEIML